MATPDHTPQGRGYDSSLHYFDAANDYWTSAYLHACQKGNLTDLWNTSAPATKAVNMPSCSQSNQAPGCVYEDDKASSAARSAESPRTCMRARALSRACAAARHCRR